MQGQSQTKMQNFESGGATAAKGTLFLPGLLGASVLRGVGPAQLFDLKGVDHRDLMPDESLELSITPGGAG